MTTWAEINNELDGARDGALSFSIERVGDSHVQLLFHDDEDSIGVFLDRVTDGNGKEWVVVRSPFGFAPEESWRAVFSDAAWSLAGGIVLIEGVTTLQTSLPIAHLPIEVLWDVITGTMGTSYHLRAEHAI